MTTTALEPLRSASALTALEHEMERFMDGFFGRPLPRCRPAALTAIAPEIEMYDHKDEIVVKASVPGLDNVEVK